MIRLFYVLLFIGLFTMTPSAQQASFDEAKTEVVMRMIGYQVLLQNSDSTTRVLPVKKLTDTQYQIRFNGPISLNPDSLVNIVKRQLDDNELQTSYIVSVKECLIQETLFSYAILQKGQKELVPCKDRELAKACYFIEISFDQEAKRDWTIAYVLLFIIACLTLFLIFKKRKLKPSNNLLKIGKYEFDMANQCLQIEEQKIKLTYKETQILSILADSPNQLIERNRIQKEVWEDEGVIVGRSLDMYISKLRKKLAKDPNISISNKHSIGYELAVKTS
ncbi:winged helix-turn-helix domain-containing protein [uncultured Arcticibacterium sp.]|uniref:winged helix-turn-helix domain-containing protein n=1 Tax=uncultured Arcticibacterium sp. TaxID=2173042 RepID=UPI0030FC7BD3